MLSFVFHPIRFSGLCFRSLRHQKKKILRFFLIIPATFLVTFFVRKWGLSIDDAFDFGLYLLGCFPFLSIFSGSRALNRYWTPGKGELLLMQPASMEEKFLNSFLNSTLLPIMGLILFIIPFSQMLLFLISMTGANPVPAMHVSSSQLFDCCKAYCFLHSFFFLGGITFARHPVSKTIFVFFLFLLAILLLLLSLKWNPFFLTKGPDSQIRLILCFLKAGRPLPDAFQNLLAYGTAPFLWTAAYLKFKELEV